MISVPKKLFKRAVKRNLLKRRIRESWRKQKHALISDTGVDILFMYPTKEILSYEEIYAAVGKIIEQLNSRMAPKKSEMADVAAVQSEPVSDEQLSKE